MGRKKDIISRLRRCIMHFHFPLSREHGGNGSVYFFFLRPQTFPWRSNFLHAKKSPEKKKNFFFLLSSSSSFSLPLAAACIAPPPLFSPPPYFLSSPTFLLTVSLEKEQRPNERGRGEGEQPVRRGRKKRKRFAKNFLKIRIT